MATERLRKLLAGNPALYPTGLPQETRSNRPSLFFGAPKDVKIGMTFPTRQAVRKVNLHNSDFAGIAHRSGAAFAIVLSGGYEDDVDNGEEMCVQPAG
ncbi:hypothetical protein V5O48_007725 [Marasmius crinis-equi]|uniref:YDG domain-containing protein n=1 Tax=Marasmius crinis-equi TaxID=585013 RepID=A0ABR3FGL2_9AGAR